MSRKRLDCEMSLRAERHRQQQVAVAVLGAVARRHTLSSLAAAWVRLAEAILVCTLNQNQTSHLYGFRVGVRSLAVVDAYQVTLWRGSTLQVDANRQHQCRLKGRQTARHACAKAPESCTLWPSLKLDQLIGVQACYCVIGVVVLLCAPDSDSNCNSDSDLNLDRADRARS